MSISRCQVVPLAEQQLSFRIDGREVTRWHHGPQYPRPFFFPLLGPRSESSVTRMGHPGAPDHEHHRSVWFAHQKLLGINFWSDVTDARIRQMQWLVYEDGEQEAGFAAKLGWFDGHDPQPLVEQELVAFLRPLDGGEYALDLQSTFVPRGEQIEFQKTNFGFLAVRVAKSISAHFGGGHLTGSDGRTGERDLFGKANAWMDYSGPMSVRTGDARKEQIEGVTFFDHPQNASYPSHWHVRDDGWMGAAACFNGPVVTTQHQPLRLRYLLHVHEGPVDPSRAEDLATEWAKLPNYRVIKATKPHRHFEIERV